MTSNDTNPIDALSGLLEERRRYEGWLDQLETRRAESPSHVVDRVRSDYLSRLDGVTQQLRGRASDLEDSATTLRERIAALQGEENTRRDERFELELRALVGEYEPEQAKDSMASCDEAIERLGSERGGLDSELSRITEVLALVSPPPPPEPEPVIMLNDDSSRLVDDSDSEPTIADVEADSLAASSGDRPDRGDGRAMDTRLPPAPSPTEELAFLRSVVDTPREESLLSDRRPTAAPRSEGGADLLPPPVLTAPRRPVTPLSSSIQSTREPLGGNSSSSILTPGSMPSFLKDMPTEQVKTLKCQECGTMNYPTEWYCERCGGELAAM
ncbi:MAG: hypothetical protein ABI910_00005 [Gemmatimonadota bacterium]